MTSDADPFRPGDQEPLYSEQEVRRALSETMLDHPAFAYYPEATREAMLGAILTNIDEHAPARIQTGDYLKRLRSELRRLQDPATLGRQAALSAVKLGGKALLDRARQQTAKVTQEPKTGPASPLPEVYYTRSALQTGLRETLRRHPQFGHYPEATRQELQGALQAALDRAAPRRLTYGTFLREMLERAQWQDAVQPLGVLGSAVKGAASGAGRSLLGSLKRRVHEYTASPEASGSEPEVTLVNSGGEKPGGEKPGGK